MLSDHGQSLGATFKQRYGETLGELVRELMGGRATVASTGTHGEGSAFVNAFLSEVSGARGVSGSVARLALASRTHDGVVDLDAKRGRPDRRPRVDIAVVGSGNLGLVYFTGNDHRLTLEELEAHAPEPGRDASRRIPGWLDGARPLGVARRRRHRCRGARYLDDGPGRRRGSDGSRSARTRCMSLRREDAMEHAPDLLLISQYDPELGEVAAFEELIGSHGGLGGFQTEPFILHPTDWELDEEVPLGRAGHLPEHPALARARSGSSSGSRRPKARQPAIRHHPIETDEAVAAAT